MVTEAQARAHAKYVKKAYSQVAIRWPKGFVEQLNAAYKASGESLAGYVRAAIEQRMERDRFKMEVTEEEGEENQPS